MSNQNIRAMAEALIKISDLNYEITGSNFDTGEITIRVPVPVCEGLTASEQAMCTRQIGHGKLDAIKSVRARLKLSLADAKEYVEKYRPSNAYF